MLKYNEFVELMNAHIEENTFIITNLMNTLAESTLNMDEIVEFVSNILYENEWDFEVDCEELMENINEYLNTLLNEDTEEIEYTLSDELKEMYINNSDQFTLMLEEMSDQAKHDAAHIARGAGSGAITGGIAGSLLSKKHGKGAAIGAGIGALAGGGWRARKLLKHKDEEYKKDIKFNDKKPKEESK